MLGRSAGTPTPLRCSVQGRAGELTSLNFVSLRSNSARESVHEARKRADPEPERIKAPEIAPAGYRLALWKRRRLSHQGSSARKCTGIKNGKLIVLAATKFDVFLKMDGDLEFKQNLATLPIADVVVEAASGR